jgi:hypothetical protein
MTVDVAMYIAGAVLVPMIGWAISVTMALNDLKSKTKELLEMHKNPDSTGFGNAPILPMIAANTAAIAALDKTNTELLIWLKATQATFGSQR